MKKVHHAPIDHRSMMKEVLGRYGLEDALQRKFAESDHLEERRERQRRKAKHHDDVLDGTESELHAAAAAPVHHGDHYRPQHVFSPSKLQKLYRQTSASAANHTPPRETAKRTPWSPRASAQKIPHMETMQTNDANTSNHHQREGYRLGNFASPGVSGLSSTSAAPLPATEVSLHDGSLCVSSLVRLQEYAERSSRNPADYAQVRAHAFDAKRREALSSAIAEGDEIMKRLGDTAPTSEGSVTRLGSPQRLINSINTTTSNGNSAAAASAVRLVVPILRSPKPVRNAAPRVEHNSLDAFTADDVLVYHSLRQAERRRRQEYREAVVFDATVVAAGDHHVQSSPSRDLSPAASPLSHKDLPLPIQKSISSTAISGMACQRLYQHGASRQNRSATSLTQPTKRVAAAGNAKQHRDASGDEQWVVSSTFKCD